MHKPRKQKKPLNDLGRSLTVFDLDRSWLIAGIVPGVGRQPLTQPVHLHLQGVHRRCGWPLAPQRVDQPVTRYDLAAGNQQAREQCHLLPGRQLDRAGPGSDPHRSQHTELQTGAVRLTQRMPAHRSNTTHKTSRPFSKTRSRPSVCTDHAA